MACSLDLTGDDAAAKKDTTVTVRVVAAKTILKQASLNESDISSDIDPANNSVSFKVPEGKNTVVLTLFPPPAPESLQVVEDCGGGVTQPILSFGPGIHASATFEIIAS